MDAAILRDQLAALDSMLRDGRKGQAVLLARRARIVELLRAAEASTARIARKGA